MEWLILLLLVPAIVVPVVGLWGFAGCSFQPKAAPPSAPINLQALAKSDQRIDLTWERGDPNTTSYTIERSSDGMSFVQIAQDVTVTKFIDDGNGVGLIPNTTYFYHVSTIVKLSSGFSDPSGPAETSAKTFALAFQIDQSFPQDQDNSANTGNFCFVQRIPFAQLLVGGNKLRLQVWGSPAGNVTIHGIYISKVANPGNANDYQSASDITPVRVSDLTLQNDQPIFLPAISVDASVDPAVDPPIDTPWITPRILSSPMISRPPRLKAKAATLTGPAWRCISRKACSRRLDPPGTRTTYILISSACILSPKSSYCDMANNLTGDYEAVVQVSTRQINGLLATLHQNGANDDKPLKLAHSATFRVGDRKPGPGDVVRGEFADWVNAYQMARGPVGLGDLRKHLAGFAPPGAAKMIEAEFSKFGQLQPRPPPPPPETVRGTVKVQLASPTLSLTPGSTTEVTLHVGVRAHYYPDPGTTDTPKPVHGEVQAAFEVRQVVGPPVVVETSKSSAEHAVYPRPGVFLGRRLLIQPSSDDNKIQFITAPGTGLSAADVDKISAQVRKAVRESFTILPVDLPSDFPFFDFKGLGGGPSQAIALPLQLSGAAAPAGAIQSINNLFIGPRGFAFGVSREYAISVFKPTLDELRQFQQDFPVSIDIVVTTLHPIYHFSVTDVELQFQNGSINLVVKGKATSPHWYAPDYNNIVITQRLILLLFLDSLVLWPRELTISGVPGAATTDVRNAVIAQRDEALPPAQAALNTALQEFRTRLNDGLHKFDPSASASFRAGSSEFPESGSAGGIEITPDGIIIRGDITGTGRFSPIVDIAETDQNSAFTALESWIPGGSIDRLIWSWVEFANPSIFSGVQKSFTDEHRFIFPKPPGITELSSICLRIEGTQTSSDGNVVSVAGGTTCQVPNPGQVLEAPSWFEPVTVPVWMPGSNEGSILKELIRGHVSAQADTPLGNELTHNSLIYFVDWRADKPLEPIVRAMEHMQRKSFSLAVIVVLPAGTFDSRRKEVEAKLGSAWERFRGRLLLTEDNEGGWTRTFATGKLPSAYLINAKREFVWKHEGESDPKELAAALDKHLLAAPLPRSRGLRLAVSPGDRAPDVFVQDDRNQMLALHRTRGREVLLNFWQSWSAPCIRELLRLKRLQKQGGERAPAIVALHGGKNEEAIPEIRKQHRLDFLLVQDTDQRIARVYGVKCWPTTISVNADGLVSHVQFGAAPDYMAEGSAQKARDIAT